MAEPARARFPDWIEGFGQVRPFTGAFAHLGPATWAPVRLHSGRPGVAKMLPSLRAAIEAYEQEDGATLSFHHHPRNGQRLAWARATFGLRQARCSRSTRPWSAYPQRRRDRCLHGLCPRAPWPTRLSEASWRGAPVMHTHGGRARALESGEVQVDAGFVAAPAAETYGNIDGIGGRAVCGTLGYAMVDTRCAERAVAVTEYLVPYPACPIHITQDQVDDVVARESIGDPQQIASGTTRPTRRCRSESRPTKTA